MKTIWLAVATALGFATLLAIAIVIAIPPPSSPPPAELEDPSSITGDVHPANDSPSSTVRPPRPPPPQAPPAIAASPDVDATFRAERLREQVHAEITAALDELRPGIAAECFAGATEPRVRLTYHLVLNAAGMEIARGISEDREAPIPDSLRDCLFAHVSPKLTVRAPGQVVSTDVTVTLP